VISDKTLNARRVYGLKCFKWFGIGYRKLWEAKNKIKPLEGISYKYPIMVLLIF